LVTWFPDQTWRVPSCIVRNVLMAAPVSEKPTLALCAWDTGLVRSPSANQTPAGDLNMRHKRLPLDYAHRVVLAAPAGLISKADVPEHCGLIVRHEVAWRCAEKATVNPRLIAQEALLKLLIDGVRREGPVVRAKYWNDMCARDLPPLSSPPNFPTRPVYTSIQREFPLTSALP
jgi:hypothetical protein